MKKNLYNLIDDAKMAAHHYFDEGYHFNPTYIAWALTHNHAYLFERAYNKSSVTRKEQIALCAVFMSATFHESLIEGWGFWMPTSEDVKTALKMAKKCMDGNHRIKLYGYIDRVDAPAIYERVDR